jgi:hypothetical protein
MSSFKKLSKSDVTVVPYHANKQWSLAYCPYPTSSEYLTIYKGTNVTGSFSLNEELVTEGQYERLVYNQVNQLFYQTYTASLDTSSLMFTLNNYYSASQQRPTSSYFVYNDSDRLVTAFPTGAMEGIRVLAINQNIYGNKLLPGNFQVSSSAYNIKDDAYGNLYDYSGSKTHVGNIFYAHGYGVITNQDYQTMFPLPPIAKNDSGSFLTTDVPKTISASLNDYARSGTLNTSSLALSGSTSDLLFWSTGSNNTVILTTTIAGTYSIYYTVGADIAGSCAVQLRSNKAKVTAIVTEPTTTTTTSTTTTTTTLAPTTSTTTTTTTVPSTTTTTTTSTTTTTTTAPPTTTSTTTTTTTAPPTTTTTTTTTSTTTTTTTAGSGTFTVKNTSGSGQIDDVTTTGGAYFYFLNTGTFPLTSGQQADGGGASLTSAPVIVTISNYSSTSCLSLYINGGLSGQLQVSGNGTYTFTNKTFTTSDIVLIEYVSGICP